MESSNRVYSKLDRQYGKCLRDEDDSVDGVSHSNNNHLCNDRNEPRLEEESTSLFSPSTGEETLKVYGYDLNLSESMRDAETTSIKTKKNHDETSTTTTTTTTTTSKDFGGVVTKARRSNSQHRRGARPRNDVFEAPFNGGESSGGGFGFQQELQVAHRQFLEKKILPPPSFMDGDEEKKDDGAGHSSSNHRVRSRIYDIERMKRMPLRSSPMSSSGRSASTLPTSPAIVSAGPSSTTPFFTDGTIIHQTMTEDDYGIHAPIKSGHSVTTRQLQIELQKTCRILDMERGKNLAISERLVSVEAELRDCKESKSNDVLLEQYVLQIRQLKEAAGRHRKELEKEKAKRIQLQDEVDVARKNNERSKEQFKVLTFQHIPSVAPKFKDIGSVDYQVRESFGYVGPYQIGKVIGEGFYGSVRVGTHLGSSDKYAVKILNKERITKFKDLQQVAVEVHVLKNYPHPNIIKLKEVIHASDNIYVVTELCAMDLHKYHNDLGLTETSAKHVILGILLPLYHLHSHGICHLDLKPENILLTKLDDMDKIHHTNVRLCDFGLVNMARKPDQSKAVVRSGYACGTPGFYAPEMVLKSKFEGREADMWSLGCILLEITLGFTKEWIECYEGSDSDPDRFRRGIESSLQEVSVERYPLHENLIDLIHKCLVLDASKRTDSYRALSHPWITDVTLPDLSSCRNSTADDFVLIPSIGQKGNNNNNFSSSAGGLLARLYRERESIVGDSLTRFCA
jgi:serine/threonine protein kinase